MQEKLKDFSKKLSEAKDFFRAEIKTLRTGRATPMMVEDIKVDYYGSSSPIKQIASISLSDPRTIVISPWNRDNLIDIEKALRESDLGVNPINDGQIIRVILPSLTEERRKELIKVLSAKTEESKIKGRKAREEAINAIEEMEKSGLISEDDKFRAKDEIQKILTEFNADLEDIREKKEKEIIAI